MSRDINGNFSRPNPDYNAGDTILASEMNAELNEIKTALTDSLSRSGLGGMSSDLNMQSHKVTNVTNGSSSGDAVNKGQLDLKANIDSPALTGTPEAPTPAVTTNSTQLATTAFVQSLMRGFSSNVYRQSIVNAPLDTSNGQPNFIVTKSISGSYTSSNIDLSNPLIVTAASGNLNTESNNRIGVATSNLTWTGISTGSSRYLLYVDVGSDGSLTTGSYIMTAANRPVYRYAKGTPSVTLNHHTFVISEMKMYVGNGTTADVKWRVPLGEIVTNGGASAVSEAYNYIVGGYYDSGLVATLPNANTMTPIDVYLGHAVGWDINLYIECIDAGGDNGYSQNDRVLNPETWRDATPCSANIPIVYDPGNLTSTNGRITFTTEGGTSAQAFVQLEKTSASGYPYLTQSKWKYGATVRRLW